MHRFQQGERRRAVEQGPQRGERSSSGAATRTGAVLVSVIGTDHKAPRYYCGRRNQNPQTNRALLFKAPREAVGLFILVVEPETLVQ